MWRPATCGPVSAGVAAALAALRSKYPQYGRVPLLSDPPTLLRFEPRALRSWCVDPAVIQEGAPGFRRP